jgi:hypothetical protein
MGYACAGGHDLDFSRANGPEISHTVPVRQGSSLDDRNDFHIFMAVHRETRLWSDQVIVKNAECAKSESPALVPHAEAEAMLSL